MVAKAPLAVAFSVLLALPPLSLAGSPAVVGEEIFLHGREHLYCISGK